MIFQSATIFQEALFQVFFLGWAFTFMAFHFYELTTVNIYCLKGFPPSFPCPRRGFLKKYCQIPRGRIGFSIAGRPRFRSSKSGVLLQSRTTGRINADRSQLARSTQRRQISLLASKSRIQTLIFCYSSTLKNKDCSKKISDPPR